MSRTLQAPPRRWWPAPEYTAAVIVQRSPQACWPVLADATQWPDWTPTVRRVDALDGPRLRLGARFRIEQPGLRTADWTVTALETARWFTWEAQLPGLRVIARHHLARLPDATLLTLALSLRGALAPLVAWRAARTVRRFLDAEAQAFKRRAEAAA